MRFNETFTIFSININCLLHSQAPFGTKFKQFFGKNGLNGATMLNLGGTAPGCKGQCCNALGFSIVYPCSAIYSIFCFYYLLCNGFLLILV